MKKIYLLLFTLVSLSATAQTITIPDQILKNWLTSSNEIAKNDEGEFIIIDSNNDGDIQLTEAAQVVSLNIPTPNGNEASYIASLSGLEYFENLKNLSIEGQMLINSIEIILSGLEDLRCPNSGLEEINKSNVPNLKYLMAYGTPIEEIDFSVQWQ